MICGRAVGGGGWVDWRVRGGQAEPRRRLAGAAARHPPRPVLKCPLSLPSKVSPPPPPPPRHIKAHYYSAHAALNPYAIVPGGPGVELWSQRAEGREGLKGEGAAAGGGA